MTPVEGGSTMHVLEGQRLWRDLYVQLAEYNTKKRHFFWFGIYYLLHDCNFAIDSVSVYFSNCFVSCMDVDNKASWNDAIAYAKEACHVFIFFISMKKWIHTLLKFVICNITILWNISEDHFIVRGSKSAVFILTYEWAYVMTYRHVWL